MRNWDRLEDEYLEQYAARGLAQETVGNVRRELDRLGCWLKNRRPRPQLEQVNSDLLIDYIRNRTAYRAKATVSGTMSVMRGWGDFLLRRGIWMNNPLRWMQGPKLNPFSRVPRRISASSLQALWQQAAAGRQEYHRYKWLAVMSLLYGTGLRRGELERLNLSDWSSLERTLRIDGRKTGRERLAAVPDAACQCVEAYLPRRQNHLEALGAVKETALFVDRHGGRLTGTAISRAIHALGRRSGIEHLTLHQFRHTCASDLLESGVHLPEVQAVLGHRTITTTVRYLHIADPQRHAAVQLHPINEILGANGALITSGGQA